MTASEPLGAFAEGEPGERGLVRGVDRGRARAEPIERSPGVRARQQRLADERLDDLDPRIERPPQLARAVDQGQARTAPARAAPAARARP